MTLTWRRRFPERGSVDHVQHGGRGGAGHQERVLSVGHEDYHAGEIPPHEQQMYNNSRVELITLLCPGNRHNMWDPNQQPKPRRHGPMVHHGGGNPSRGSPTDEQRWEGDLYVQPDRADDAGAARGAGDRQGHRGVVQLGPGRGGVQGGNWQYGEVRTTLSCSVRPALTNDHLVHQQRPEQWPQRGTSLHNQRAEREQSRP